MLHKKLTYDFGKFLYVGAVWTIINIFFMWIIIDIWGMPGWLGSSFVVIASFLGRYYHYLRIGLIHDHFMKYTYTNIGFSLATIALMSLAVDILGFSAKLSSPIIIGGLFLLKFITFKKIKLIKD